MVSYDQPSDDSDTTTIHASDDSAIDDGNNKGMIWAYKGYTRALLDTTSKSTSVKPIDFKGIFSIYLHCDIRRWYDMTMIYIVTYNSWYGFLIEIFPRAIITSWDVFSYVDSCPM